MKIQFRTIVVGVALAASLCAGSALADSMKFKAALSGTEEVPPTKSKAAGAIDATYDSTGRVVQGNASARTQSTEVWTFLRAPGGRWILSAIQQTQ